MSKEKITESYPQKSVEEIEKDLSKMDPELFQKFKELIDEVKDCTPDQIMQIAKMLIDLKADKG